jgi:hypothetical protein
MTKVKDMSGPLMMPFRAFGVSRPGHFKQLRTGDARPLRLSARDGGQASPLPVPRSQVSGAMGSPPFRNFLK